MTRQRIERLDGSLAPATYVRHVRTLTAPGGKNYDVELYRLDDGAEVECMSTTSALSVPEECDPAADHYPGFTSGA